MEKRAVLITFNVCSKEFSGNYERNKFFRGLYGWKQMVRKETKEGKKKYEYERKGVLDEVAHKKVDQSSFIVEQPDAQRMFDFFDEWTNKVMWNTFKVLIDENIFRELENMRGRIEKEMEEESEEDEDGEEEVDNL